MIVIASVQYHPYRIDFGGVYTDDTQDFRVDNIDESQPTPNRFSPTGTSAKYNSSTDISHRFLRDAPRET